MSLRRFIHIVFLFLTTNTFLYGQSIFMGVRENQFAQIGFLGKQNWFVIAENSVFISKVKNQTFNGYVGYNSKIHSIEYMGSFYGGFHYNRLYNSIGGIMEVGYSIFPWLKINVGVRPHYDTDYGYETAYKGGIDIKLHNDISLLAEYSNYPEYRICENRIKAGLIFKVKDLCVKPIISIPTEGYMENIRLLVSFGYKLKL